MEALRTKQLLAADPDSDPAWRIVRRWPRIRGEPKIAWQYLWRQSQRGREQIAVKPVDLGADQNTSDDAGARYLRTLADEGLIELRDLGRGVKLVTCMEPLDVAKARRACGGDSQLAFGFLEELEAEEAPEYPPAAVSMAEAAVSLSSATAEVRVEPRRPADGEPVPLAADPRPFAAVPPAEPRNRRGSTLGTAVRADKDKDNALAPSETKTKTETNKGSVLPKDQPPPRNRGTDRGSEGGTAVAALADVLGEATGRAMAGGGALAALLDGTANERALERVKARIADAVRDPDAWAPMLALAHAYADGRVPDVHLDALLRRVASGRKANGEAIANRGGFFRQQVRYKFRDLGIREEDYFPKKPREVRA